MLIETFSDCLGLGNGKIERTHRVGDSKLSTKRTVVAKITAYKDNRTF